MTYFATYVWVLLILTTLCTSYSDAFQTSHNIAKVTNPHRSIAMLPVDYNVVPVDRNTQLQKAKLFDNFGNLKETESPLTRLLALNAAPYAKVFSNVASEGLLPLLSNKWIKSAVLIPIWYYVNIQFNIHNKKALMISPTPLTISALQALAGVPLFLLPWVSRLRPMPVFHSHDLETFKPFTKLALWHSILHLSAMRALSAGAVSFVSVIKAGEPVLTALLSRLLAQKKEHLYTYISLIPIIAGISMASVAELSFSWPALANSMISNLASALRTIYGKGILKDKSQLAKHLSPNNVFALVALFAVPFEVLPALIEFSNWRSVFEKIKKKDSKLLKHVVISGIAYYAYNDLAFEVLSNLTPLTHAVCNALKRVNTIIISSLVFSTEMTKTGILGTALAISGAFSYSLSKLFFK